MKNPEANNIELAEQYGESEFNPETNEEHEKLRQVARNIIDCYDWVPTKEEFLIVTDTKVMKDNPLMLRALEYELQAQGRASEKDSERTSARYFKTLVTKASTKSATPLGETIGQAMKDKPVLIITSMSRSHSQETGAAIRGDTQTSREGVDQILSSEKMQALAASGFSGISPEKLDEWSGRIPDDQWQKLQNLAKERRLRLISITKGHNPYEILTKGAVMENVENLRERGEKLVELMKDVKRVHLTTPLGTDLWLSVRPDLSEVEDGDLSQPGSLSNYPIGEWACSPDWKNSSGTLVVDGPCGGNINQDILDQGEPMRLEIENGHVVRATGGETALKMWHAYLDSGNNKNDDAYRLAEFAVGTNGRALENKERKDWGSSEGEKRYGTAHVAVGSNGSFGRTPDDPNFNAARVHCDMILGLNKGGEVTIKCERKDGTSFKLMENGRPIEY